MKEKKKFKKDRLGKLSFSSIDSKFHNWDDIDFLDNYIYSSQKIFGLESLISYISPENTIKKVVGMYA